MKFIMLFVFSIGMAVTAQCQVKQIGDTCISGIHLAVRAHINGERDTVDRNGLQKVINRSLIVNGFDLLLTDTTYEILRYEISFEFDDPLTLVRAPNKGAKLKLSREYGGYLKKMMARGLFIIDWVWIKKNDQCYLINGPVYYTD